jgi:hypothetical protein
VTKADVHLLPPNIIIIGDVTIVEIVVVKGHGQSREVKINVDCQSNDRDQEIDHDRGAKVTQSNTQKRQTMKMQARRRS